MQFNLRYWRLCCVAIVLAVAALLGTAWYMEHVQGLEPCPLCIAQRLAFALAGGVAILGVCFAAWSPARRMVAAGLLIAALMGAGLAARQVWLQHLPADAVPACGFGLEFMLEAFPLQEVILQTLKGTGECAKVQWVFLGLSIPEWTLLIFTGLAVLAVFLWRPVRRPLG